MNHTVSSPPKTARRHTIWLVATTLALTVVPLGALPSAPAQAAPATFTIKGSGFGHGIGMSQYGARAQAVAGRTAAQILAFYYHGTKVVNKTTANIKVQIAPSASSVTFLGAGGKVTAGGTTKAAAVDEVVKLAASGGQVILTGSVFGKLTLPAGQVATFAWSSGGYIMVGGANAKKGYGRGKLEISNIGGKVNASINLPLARDYVYGLAEVPSSWEPAALQAQAIAARSYAYPQGLKADCNCNVYSTTTSQVYNGRDKELEAGGWGAKWVAAVNATAGSATSGKLLTDASGKVLTAYYYASSAGRTENNEDVWTGGTPQPYLRSVADPWSLDKRSGNPYTAWTETISQSTMAKAFGLPDVAKIQPTGGTTSGGAPRFIKATASNGTAKQLAATDFRFKLGLKSTWITLTGPPPAVTAPFPQVVLSPGLAGGKLGDVLAVDSKGLLVRYPFTASKKLAKAEVLGKGWSDMTLYAPGDWNQNGKADLVGVDAAGRMFLYPGNGKGGIGKAVQIGHGWAKYTVIPAGDLTGDKIPDMLAINQKTGALLLYSGNGKGGFKPGYKQVGHGWKTMQLFAAGDLNKDGKVDVLGVKADGRLYFYAGRGDGYFKPSKQVGHGWKGMTLAAGADLNGDGRADIVGKTKDHRLLYYQGKGGGTFAKSVQIGTGW